MSTGEGAGWGLFWGSLIGGLLAMPFTAGASAAAAGGAVAAGALAGGTLGVVGGAIDADWWRDEFGISETFVRDMGHMIGTGDSGNLHVAPFRRPEYVAQQLAPYGGKLLWTTLTSEQEAKLQSILDTRGFTRKAA